MMKKAYSLHLLKRSSSEIKHLKNDSSLLKISINNVLYNSYSSQIKELHNVQNKLLYDSNRKNCFQIFRFVSNVINKAKSVMEFNDFKELPDKNRETFLKMAQLYEKNFPTRKGVVDFIYAALKHMKEYGVHEQLDVYKTLLRLMPEGKYVPENRIQMRYFHFPREQDCVIILMDQMEHYGVIPDPEFGDILIARFGSEGHPARKFYRMMYWLPKFKNLTPFPLPRPLPREPFALGKLAVERITSVDLQTEITVFQTAEVQDSNDKTWVVSGQSPKQRELLGKHDLKKPVIVEGGDHVWLRNRRINYFTLKSEDVSLDNEILEFSKLYDTSDLKVKFLNLNYEKKEDPSVHEQKDGRIYAVCATGTSTKDSLLSWIRLLQENGNPILKDLVVLFRFKSLSKEPVPVSHSLVESTHRKSASP